MGACAEGGAVVVGARAEGGGAVVVGARSEGGGGGAVVVGARSEGGGGGGGAVVVGQYKFLIEYMRFAVPKSIR